MVVVVVVVAVAVGGVVLRGAGSIDGDSSSVGSSRGTKASTKSLGVASGRPLSEVIVVAVGGSTVSVSMAGCETSRRSSRGTYTGTSGTKCFTGLATSANIGAQCERNRCASPMMMMMMKMAAIDRSCQWWVQVRGGLINISNYSRERVCVR